MIRVMSFNIRYGTADDGDNGWERRRGMAVDRIRVFEPDLLGLQECRDDAQARFVRLGLPEYDFHGVRREGGGDTAIEMAPVLWRKERFGGAAARGCFWLSDTKDVAGSIGWDAHFARTVTWADVVHAPTGRAIRFVNTHFDLRPWAIEQSARLLRAWIGRAPDDLPVVLTGDFNAVPASPAHAILTEGGRLRDAHAPAGSPPTFHGFGRPELAAAIDWILVTGHFRVATAGVDGFHEAGRFPSDHHPVTAVLDWA